MRSPSSLFTVGLAGFLAGLPALLAGCGKGKQEVTPSASASAPSSSAAGRGILMPATVRRAIDEGAGASKEAGRQAGSGAHEPGGPHHVAFGAEGVLAWLTIFSSHNLNKLRPLTACLLDEKRRPTFDHVGRMEFTLS